MDFPEIQELIDNLKKISENHPEKPEEEPVPVLGKDEFFHKLATNANFRSQVFSESLIYQNIINQVNKDSLYSEYTDMKKNRVGLLSQFVKGPILFVSERFGNRVRVKYLEYDYDVIGFHNFPMSDDSILPTDERELKYWKMSAGNGCYTFEESDEEVGDYLSFVRMPSIKKDVFLYNGEVIVHVQDCDIQFDSNLDEAVFTRFTEYLDTFGDKDYQKMFDKLLGEFSELNKKADQ